MPVEWSATEDWLENQDENQIERNGDGTFQLGQFTAVDPQTLYDFGSFAEYWVEGYTSGTGSTQKLSNSLRMNCNFNSSTAAYTFVTFQQFDVTDYDTLEITWENTGASDFNNQSEVLLLDGQNDNFPANTVTSETGDFAQTTVLGDISGQSGSYYIGLRGADGSSKSQVTVTLDVYFVELNNA